MAPDSERPEAEEQRPSGPKENIDAAVVMDMSQPPAGSTRRACVSRNRSVYERKRRAALVSELRGDAE